MANLASGVIFDTKATAEDLSLVVQEAIHGPRHIGKATPDNGLVERGISRRTVSPACDVRQSTGRRASSPSFAVLFCGIRPLLRDGPDVRTFLRNSPLQKKHLSHFDKPDIIYHSDITYIRRRWNIR